MRVQNLLLLKLKSLQLLKWLCVVAAAVTVSFELSCCAICTMLSFCIAECSTARLAPTADLDLLLWFLVAVATAAAYAM